MHRLIIGGVAIALVVGCSRKEECSTGKVVEAAAPTEPAPTAVVGPNAALRTLKRELILSLKALEMAAANESSWNSSVLRATRQELMLDVKRRIPDEPWDRDHFRRDLADSGIEYGVVLRDIRVIPRAAHPPEIPGTVTRAYEWPVEVLRTAYDVTFRVDASSAHPFKRWHAGLPDKLGRLLYVTTAEEVPGGWDLTAEMYAFRKVTVPRHVVEPETLDDKLNTAGIGRASITTDADRALLADCEGLLQKIAATIPAAETSMVPLTRSNYLQSRFDFFRKRVSDVERTSANQLLGRDQSPIP